MRIDRVEIDGFGKLNHVALSFSDGFNLIVGDNESGKSTLCEFLLAMFYDLPNAGRKKTNSQPARKKYRPWTGSAFGGRVFFTDGGVSYVLEKAFGETEKYDRVNLVYADTWEPAGDAKNVGERFFGLGREGFLKTLYIKNPETDREADAAEIMTRLSNLETGADEELSYDKIKTAMEVAHDKILTKTGRGGSLYHLREEERRLESDVYLLEKKREQLYELEDLIAERSHTVEELQKSRVKTEEQLKIAREYEIYQSGQRAEQSRQVVAERYRAECERLQACRNEYEAEVRTLSDEITEEVLQEAEALEREVLLSENSPKVSRKKKRYIPIAALWMTGVAAGVMLSLWHRMAGVGVACASFVAGILLFCFWKAKEHHAATEEAELLRRNLQFVLNKYGADSVQTLRKMMQEQERIKIRLAQTKQEILRLERDTEALHQSLLVFPTANAGSVKPAEPYTGEPTPALEEKLWFLAEKLNTAERELQEIQMELAMQTAGEKSIAEVTTELLSVKERIRMQERSEAAISKAQEWLERAHQEIKENFAPMLNRKMGEIFAELTDGNYHEVRIGENLSLRCRAEGGVITDSDAFSSGTCDLLYISMRLAILMVLFSDWVPPIITDDAFFRMDDKRHHNITAYLRKSSCFGQVLSFTCRREGNPIIHDKNINLIDLNKEGVLEHELQD